MALLASNRNSRGSSLLFVVVMLAVLAIVGLAVITQANSEADGSSAKRQYDRSVACADAARQMITSQFRLFGLTITSLVLNTQLDGKTLKTGHYDNVSINSITLATGSTAGSLGVSDAANKIGKGGFGGLLYRVNVVCSSANLARQAEVEFLMRYGI